MHDYLPFIVIGLFTGAVYSLAAAGLVLTYKTSGVFNFAHGAIGMFVAFVFYQLSVDWGWSVWLSIAVSVLVVAPAIGAVLDRVLLRRLEGGTAATYVVASLGLLVFLQGLAIVWRGGGFLSVPHYFSLRVYRVAGVNVTAEQMIVVAIAVATGLGLVAFFRFTRLGLRTRAVVSDRDLTSLVGTSPRAVTTFSWMLGCSFAALSAILLAPAIGLDAVSLTLLVLTAVGAAAAGRFRSLSVTMVAAFGIGVAQSVATKMIGTNHALAGIPPSIPFIVLFAVLVFSRKGAFVAATTREKVRRSGVVGPSRFPMRTFAGLVGAAAILPVFVKGFRLQTATTTVCFVLVFASLSLLVGLARQVSLAHVMFAAFGATTLSTLLRSNVPYLPALLLAALAMVPLGALVAIPAIRLSGLFLALATFGLGKLAQDVIFPTSLGFGTNALARVPRPSLFVKPVPFYYFVLAVVVVGVLMVETLRVSRLGRILRALADSPTAVESLGINPTVSRVLAFCLSAFLAGLAGGLLGSIVQVINPTSFDFTNSLIWVTVLVAAGAATLGGSVLAAVMLAAIPAMFSSSTVTEWQPVFFGLGAMVLAQAPNGLIGLIRQPDWARLAEAGQWRADARGARNEARLGRRVGAATPIAAVDGRSV